MKVKVYGTRGSYPVCRRDTVVYGGNTTCFSVEEGETRLILDAGTGLRDLGHALVQQHPHEKLKLSLLLSHTHWDHVMGLPFFAPLSHERFQLTLLGADSETMRLPEIIARQLEAHDIMPLQVAQLPGRVRLQQLSPGDAIQLGSCTVRTLQLNHPGTDLGYRIESAKGVLVFLTDLAPIEDNLLGQGWKEQAAGRERAFEQHYWDQLVGFVCGADLLIHDTNFTDEEIQHRRHWGHSTASDALRLLSELDAPPALVLSHHDPDHSDAVMDAIYERARRHGRDRGVDVLIAREGGEFRL